MDGAVSVAQGFVKARDFLLHHRADYNRAYRKFTWSKLDTFNWTLDYFDVMARGSDNSALWIVDDPQGSGLKLSFMQISERPSHVVSFLCGLDIVWGDRLLLILPNRVGLWDMMLETMKLGVMVLSVTTQLLPDDTRDRIELGDATCVVVDTTELYKFDSVNASIKHIAVGVQRDGQVDLAVAYDAPVQFAPDGLTKATNLPLLYFASGTTSKPKLVKHTHQGYPAGHLSIMHWIGLQPGGIHWNISSSGWAKHMWSCFFALWNAQACVFAYNYVRFMPKDTLDVLVCFNVITLCTPPTARYMLVQGPLVAYAVKLHEIIGAGKPLNPETTKRVYSAWGATIHGDFGQTETTCQVGNTPGQPVVSDSVRRLLSGYYVELVDRDDQPASEGEIALLLSHHPLGLMQGYVDNAKATGKVMRNDYYHTSDVAIRRDDDYFVYMGRTDGVFKSSDYRLSPFEPESVLIEHKTIAETAMMPSSDPLRLSVPKASATVRQGYEVGPGLARIVSLFSYGKLTPYKHIRRLQFSELPKTISRKVRRVELHRLEFECTPQPARLPGECWEEDSA